MSPQLRVNRLRAFATIAKEFIVVAIYYEAAFFVRDQAVFTLGNKTLTHSLYVCRIKIAVVSVAIV